MGKVHSSMLLFPGFFLMCGVAAASCNIDGYDQAWPRAFRDEVDNQFARFEWASDLDPHTGRPRVWNFVWNKGSEALGVDWPKAGIKVPLLNPLPAGHVFCHKYYVSATSEDTDAPIAYGTNRQVQRAAVFAENRTTGAAPSAFSTTSQFETTYMNEKGELTPGG
jgi:hypothetical protein